MLETSNCFDGKELVALIPVTALCPNLSEHQGAGGCIGAELANGLFPFIANFCLLSLSSLPATSCS
jgi:hypothetical protein